MAYVAVSGGEDAIAASLGLLRDELHSPSDPVSLDALATAVPELIDQVMGEGSLYAPHLAALALKQGGGSVEEAVFLLRAFRSTLERTHRSRAITTDDMRVFRRISAAFKDIPGGQLLGSTRDYSHRLLDFTLDTAPGAAAADAVATADASPAAAAAGAPVPPVPAAADAPVSASSAASDGRGVAIEELMRKAGFSGLPRVSAYLVEQGLMIPPTIDDTEPSDVTVAPLAFPAPRSARLQTLARGMTQAVLALGYAAIRGFGPAHPTVGELRQGSVEILVDHPLSSATSPAAPSAGEPSAAPSASHAAAPPTGELPAAAPPAAAPEDACYLGSIPVTEVESLFEIEGQAGSAQAAREDTSETPACELTFSSGYGLVIGRCESKAIAMSVLDHCLEREGTGFPTEDEEFVLSHVDGIEATGFVSHLKLPHYVTFQSKLDGVRMTRAGQKAPREPDSSYGSQGANSPPSEGCPRKDIQRTETDGMIEGEGFYGTDV